MIIYIIIVIILLYLYNQSNLDKNIKISEKYKNNINHLSNLNNVNHLSNLNNFKKNLPDIKYNKNILTNYGYFINECDLCPIGSYKQCSNNYSYKNYPPEINCNAYNLTQDLCKEKYSQKFLVKNNICNYWDKQKNIILYPKNNPRVNIWNSS